jgi:hypothetical protein
MGRGCECARTCVCARLAGAAAAAAAADDDDDDDDDDPRKCMRSL